MKTDSSNCPCFQGPIVFHEGLSFTDAGASHGQPASTMRSPNIPESWKYQWFVELRASNPDEIYVGSPQYSDDSPLAEITIKIGSNPSPLKLSWPVGQKKPLNLKLPDNLTYTGLMKNDSLKVHFTLTVSSKYTYFTRRSFEEQFRKLFVSKLGTDAVIACKNGEIPAHWAVLAARSPFFSAMLSNEYQEKQDNKIELEISLETSNKMLEFIYSNEVEIQSIQTGQDLLAAGDMYLVDGLKVAAEHYLCSKLTKENALDFAIVSHLHGAEELKKNALDVIASDFYSATQNGKFPDILKHPDLMKELLSMSTKKKG